MKKVDDNCSEVKNQKFLSKMLNLSDDDLELVECLLNNISYLYEEDKHFIRQILNNKLGREIREARVGKGLTQMELSKISGLSYQNIRRIESGMCKKPLVNTFEKISKCLELDLSEVLDIGGDKEKDESSVLGQKIREARVGKDLTQTELSNISGLSYSNIRSIESGKIKKPRVDNLRKLSKSLNLDLSELLDICGYTGKEKSDSLAQKIKEARASKGLTQRELARVSGLSYSSICNLESGKNKNPKENTLEVLSKCLELEFSELLELCRCTDKLTGLAKKIKEARVRNNLTQRDLAKVSGLSYLNIRSIENEKIKKPRVDSLRKLSKSLNLDFNELLDICGYTGKEKSSSLAKKIRKARVRNNLTQRELAKVSGLSYADIRSIESGKIKKPRVDNLRRLSKSLNLDFNELLYICLY